MSDFNVKSPKKLRSNSLTDQAKHLRDKISEVHQVKVRSSHAHQALANALGFKTKVALLDEYPSDSEYLDFILHHKGYRLDENRLFEGLDSCKDDNFKSLSRDFVVIAIKESLTPECENGCGKTLDSQPLFNSDDIDQPIAQVCDKCSHDSEDYSYCIFCGDSLLYRANELNEAGECPEHSGESVMDEEEAADWESYTEYLNK